MQREGAFAQWLLACGSAADWTQAMYTVFSFALQTVLGLFGGQGPSDLSQDAELETLLKVVADELQRREDTLAALGEVNLKAAMRFLKLAFMGVASEKGSRESGNNYRTAEESAMKAFSVVTSTAQKLEATKIAVVAGYFCGLGSNPSQDGLRDGIRTAQNHLARLLQDEKVKKVMNSGRENFRKSIAYNNKRRELARNVGRTIVGFLELARRGCPEERTHMLSDGRCLEQILAGLSYAKEQTLKGHSKFVWSLAATDEWLFSGSHDNTIRVWRIGTWECVKVLRGHTSEVDTLVATSEWLFSCSGDSTIRIWSMGSWECATTLEGYTVYSLAVSEDRLFTGCDDGTIQVLKMGSWECERVLEGPASEVLSLAVLDGGLVSGYENGGIRVWKADTWECVRNIEGHTREVLSLVASGSLLFCSFGDNTVRVRDMATWECVHTLGQQSRKEITKATWVNSLVAHNGCVYTGSKDGTIRVRSVDTWQCWRVLEGHTGAVGALVVMNEWLFSASHDKTIRVWRRLP